MAFGTIMGQSQSIDTSQFVTYADMKNYALASSGPIVVYASEGSHTFTAQQTGTYKITAVGGGGNGGVGSSIAITSRTAYSGRGGGSGAVAVFLKELQTNNTISISISSKTVTINNNEVVCTSGSDGGNGSVIQSSTTFTPTGGEGGTVSSTIELIYSVNGVRGNYSQGSGLRGIGGVIPIICYFPAIYENKAGIYVGKGIDGSEPYSSDSAETTYPDERAFGGLCGTGGDGSCSYTTSIRNGTGAQGGPAAVFIEYLGNF